MKGQSKRSSLIESVLNLIIGFGVAMASQYVIFPVFGIYIEVGDHLLLSLFFTGVSLVRSYFVRRAFNRLHIRGILI